MKKFIAGAIALSLVCGMSACGSSDSSSSGSSESSTETTTTTTTASPETTTTAATSEKTTTASTAEITETTTTTEETTTTTTEAASNLITNTEEYVSAIGSKIKITDITRMAAEMIDAEEGTSFKYNGNKFEIYKYAEGNSKLEEAKSGSMSYTIEGFGDFTSTTIVNGNYVMLFKTEDSDVTDVFMSITL